MDIPARFTSGFIVTVPRGGTGEDVTITDRFAHAWVEVYYDDIGWLPLEVTPPATGTGIPDGRPHAYVGGGGSASDDYYEDDMIPDWMLDMLMDDMASGAPGRGAVPDVQENTGMSELGLGILIVACAAGFMSLLILRRTLAWKYRNRHLNQANTNEAVIYAWRFITHLNRKTIPPIMIEDIALKARFSQHNISEEERSVFVKYAFDVVDQMFRYQNAVKRLWLKWGRGI